MWRLSDDFWDTGSQLRKMFDYANEWSPSYRTGNRIDCDMVPFGNIRVHSVDGGNNQLGCRFTKSEKRTLVSLWYMVKSPIMYGGDLSQPDVDIHFLMNSQINEMNSNIEKSSEIYRDKQFVIWQATGKKASYLAFFNITITI